MRRKSIFILTACLLVAGTCFAQTKKPTKKPKPKPKTSTVKKTTPPPAAEDSEPVCYPLKELKDYYKIDLKDSKFKSDFDEIFELSPYDYSGYSIKSIIENTIRMRQGNEAANSLDIFAGGNYAEISFNSGTHKKAIIDEICKLFADPDEFEKYINKLKKMQK